MSDRSNGPVMDGEDRRGPECAYVADLADPFVLGAAEPSEQERIHAHLDTCPRCRELIAGLQRAVALLPFLSSPASPTPAVRAALMSRIEQSRQANTRLATARPSATPRPRPVEAPPVRRFHPGLSALPLAAVLLAALIWSFSLQQRLNRTEDQLADAQQAGVASLLNSPVNQASMYTLQPMCTDCQSGGRLKGSPHGDTAVLVAWALDPRATYEVWIETEDQTWLKITTLDVSSSGDAFQLVDLERPLSACRKIAVSTVPAGNADASPTPELMVEMVFSPEPAGTSTFES